MRKYSIILCAAFLIGTVSCSKKSNPSKSDRIIYNGTSATTDDKTTVEKTEEAPPAPKPTTVKRSKPTFPKTIYVNDAAAKKSVDGRLYYDVEGHRYWKNYKDGKYYIFNKSMYNDPDFLPPKK